MTQAITSFRGQYGFLSNFWMCDIPMEHYGVIAKSVEHAFQAEKMTCELDRRMVLAAPTPGAAKKVARSLPMRDDWEKIKIQVMCWYVDLKFRDGFLRQQLLATGDAYIIEGNTWGDVFWGAVWRDGQWQGQNHLGLILMEERSQAYAA